jgi:hypothetical protein
MQARQLCSLNATSRVLRLGAELTRAGCASVDGLDVKGDGELKLEHDLTSGMRSSSFGNVAVS